MICRLLFEPLNTVRTITYQMEFLHQYHLKREHLFTLQIRLDVSRPRFALFARFDSK